MEQTDAKMQAGDGERESNKPLVVAGIGVGAESLEVARQIIDELVTADQKTSIAVVLSVVGVSDLTELKEQIANLTIVNRHVLVPIRPSVVYLSENGTALVLRDGKLQAFDCSGRGHESPSAGLVTSSTTNRSEQHAPIDSLLESLADNCGELAVGVILSGGGTDGTLGLRAISDAGGMTIAQHAESAAQRSMPQSAAALGIVDHVLTPNQIASEIRNHAQHMTAADDRDGASELNRQIIVAIPQIAAAVETHTQNDFKHYKTTTLARRIRRRIHILKLPSVDAYIELLQASREEALQLFRDLLISVTAFFRDPKAFDSLAQHILTPLVKNHQGDGPIRIWVPGCATGQEAYSIAILMQEIIQRSERNVSFQIFATDLDDRALNIARAGGYPVGIQDEVSAARLQKHFTKRGNKFFVAKAIRDSIVFSAHNLISDPPFTKLDLISCRNLLIYLGSHLQKKLIPLFHYAINPGGYLFLGPSETLSVNKELFRTLHTQHRLFQRRLTALDSPPNLDVRLVNMNRFSHPGNGEGGEVDLFRYAQQIVLGEFSPQWAVIDDDGEIHSLSSDPAPFLQLTAGKFKNNVIAMAHDNIRIGLRAALAEAKRHRRRALAEDMSLPLEGGLQRVHITVQPMPEMGEEESLHLVAFHRIGTPLRVDDDPNNLPKIDATTIADKTATKVIEQLEIELSRTRDALERTVQELESSNEELKSSNEELLSMNEELQSANEELETSKEELQTSNEQLGRSNNDIQNLLRSTQIATVFLDNDLRIRGFTPAVCEIYDLQEPDVGRPLTLFVPQVGNMPELPDPVSLQDEAIVEDKVATRHRRTYIRRVIPYRTPGGENDGIVVTFSDVTELNDSQELFKLLIEASTQIVWTTDASGTVVDDSLSWREFTGQTFEQWVSRGWLDAIHPEDQQATISKWLSVVESGEYLDVQYRLRHVSGEYHWTQVRAVPQRDHDGTIRRWVGMNTDIHDRKTAEEQLLKSESLIRTIAENSTHALFMMDERGYVTYCNEVCVRMFGYDLEELQSKPLHDLIHHHHPDGRRYPMSECPIDRALPEDYSVRAHEDWFFRKDGSSFPVLCAASPIFEDGKPISTVIEVRDITEQKQFEGDLQDREAHLRRVIDHQLGMVGVLETDGTLVEANSPALLAAGLRREDVIGRRFWDCYWWNYDDAVTRQLQEAFARAMAGETVRYDATIRVADDARTTIDFMLHPVRNDAGDITHLIPSGVDISERKQIETQLARAMSRLELSLEVSEIATWSWNMETNEVLSNPALNRMFGFEENEQLTLSNFIEQMDEAVQARIGEAIQRTMETGCKYDEEYPIRLRDGQIRHIRAVGRVQPPIDGQPSEFFGIVSNMTDRKLYEINLRESEQRFRRLANAAPAMLWVTDENHQCTFLSQSWYDFTGQVEPDGYGLGWTHMVHPDEREDAGRIFLAAAEHHEPYEIDFRLKTADGGYRWVIDSGRPRFSDDGSFEGYVGSVIDADERHRAQTAIAMSEERLRTAAAAAGFGMLHADIEAGVVTYSQEMKSLLRLPDDAYHKLTPGAIPDWVHEDDRAMCGDFYRLLLSLPEGESRSIDHRIIRPDGELRWVRLQAKPVHTGSGKNRQATQLIGTIVDITQQRDFEESLQQARAQAIAASESKSAFLANMSHEIRTPMTAILGYADLLREHLSNEEAIGHLGTIRRNGGYLLEIINDILDLSKIEAGKFEIDRERFDVTRVIEDVRSVMEVRAKENNLQLEVVYDGKLPSLIESDSKRLKQILINLVGNAIKFTKNGGVKIVVDFIKDPERQGSSIRSTTSGAKIRFRITDTGIGMNREQQAKLFRPFVQGDSSVSRHFGGTGLGLAISRRLTSLLGGEVDVVSELGKGSTFTFTIATGNVADSRLVDPQTIAVNDNSHDRDLSSTLRLDCNVLVVDDRRDIRFLSKHILTKAGATVNECEDGQQAVDYIRDKLDRASPPDLIVLDMQMPNLDGYQTAVALRRLGFAGPIIALTADAMQGDMNKCLEAGCNDYLSKPIDQDQMLQKVLHYISLNRPE